MTESPRSINPNRIGWPVLMIDVKTNTLADGLIERISSMLDEIEYKTVHNNKEGDRWRKKK